MKTTFAAELLLNASRAGEGPLHQQIERQLRAAIQAGRLTPGERLPSTRTLAKDLGVARGVVVEAYEQLVAEGHLASELGSGTRVAPLRSVQIVRAREEVNDAGFVYDFLSGVPDPLEFPRRAWLSCLTRAVKAASSDLFRYPESRGVFAARSAVAGYLARARATAGGADQVVICGGFTQGISLVAQVLKSVGIRRVAIEDPTFGNLHTKFRLAGLEVQPIPVDGSGLRVDLLEAATSAAVVTPAHQFPSGACMAKGRRAALLRWAAQTGAYVVEDDYDSELWYDQMPMGSLQGLAPDRIIYSGTVSKTLTPALRLGWLVVPPDLIDEFIQAKRASDAGSPAIDQIALAEFLDSGEMDRHLRRVRPVYRRRRDALEGALKEYLPDLRVYGTACGLHVMVELPKAADEAAVVWAASRRSVRLTGVGRFRATDEMGAPALVLGFGCIEEGKIRDGVRRLAEVVQALLKTEVACAEPDRNTEVPSW